MKQATFEVSLARHRQLAPDVRAVFVFRYFNRSRINKVRKAARAAERVQAAGNYAGSIDEFAKILRVALVTWRNVVDVDGAPVPYDPDRIEDVCTIDDLQEFISIARQELNI